MKLDEQSKGEAPVFVLHQAYSILYLVDAIVTANTFQSPMVMQQQNII